MGSELVSLLTAHRAVRTVSVKLRLLRDPGPVRWEFCAPVPSGADPPSPAD